jgi:hypothetical protein
MEKKIKMIAEEKKVLRISVPTDNGTAVVNNPSESFKDELLKTLVNSLTKNEDFDEKKIMLDLINHCTNVEFEGDIFKVEHLTHEAKIITNEIFIIFQEIIQEAYQVLRLAMQQAKNEMIQKEILDEKDNMLKMAEKVKKEEKEEIEIPKVVKKPQRSRKRK